MKTATLAFVTLFLFFCSVHGQSPVERDFVPFRPDMKSEFNTAVDPRKFAGTWISLQGDITLKIYQDSADVLVGGDYFPGVASQGDRAKLTISTYPAWMKKDPALRTINISYATSHSVGGGGGGVTIAYSPSTGHLIIGTPPYNTFENGQWVGHGGTVASNGIYGKEFKRVTSPALRSPLHIDVISANPIGFETPDCTYSKTSGGLPVFLINISGAAAIKIDGIFFLLKLQKAGSDKAGNVEHTFEGTGLEVIVKTGRDFKNGVITVQSGQNISRVAITGSCTTDAGD